MCNNYLHAELLLCIDDLYESLTIGRRCEILLKKKEDRLMVRDDEQSVFPNGEELTTNRPHSFIFLDYRLIA
jgi:hypothetical protein